MFRVIEYFANSLKVIQSHRKWHHLIDHIRVPIGVPKATMALSCIISEIKRNISRKSRFFHTPLDRRPHCRISVETGLLS